MKIIQAQNSGYLGFIKKENKNGVENSQKFVVNDRQKQTIVPLRSNNIGVLTFGRKVDNQNKIIQIASKYINSDLNNLKKVSSTLMFEKDKALNVYKSLENDNSLSKNDKLTIANLVYCQNYSEIYQMANEIENLPDDLDYDKRKARRFIAAIYWNYLADIAVRCKNKVILSECIDIFKKNLYIVKGDHCPIVSKLLFLRYIIGNKLFLRFLHFLLQIKSSLNN